MQCDTGHSITTIQILFAIDTFATSMDQHATTPFQTWILKQLTASGYRQLVLTTGQVHSQLQELQQHYLLVSIIRHI